MSHFNVQQQHPLIPREQTFVLDRKLISIHSYDRDIKKWPNSHHFEIDLPESMQNVQSMRLLNISLPSNQYIFSNAYQNTKLEFAVEFEGVNYETMITIEEGSYPPTKLTTEIQSKMNKAVSIAVGEGYCDFRCYYNCVTNQFWFGNIKDSFTLHFERKISYDIGCNDTEVWNNYKRWGLPAYLGYKKNKYTSTLTPKNPWITNEQGDPFGFDYEICNGGGNEWLDGSNNNVVNVDIINKNHADPSGVCNLDIMGEDYIYMELDKYNSMDEIEPYSTNTSGWPNNDYGGKVKCAFAKIPVQCTPYSQSFDSTRSYIANISHYNPPIERIDKLRFKLRYHDGRLVDFRCLPFSFTLEFNMLRDEQLKAMSVRVPPLYCL